MKKLLLVLLLSLPGVSMAQCIENPGTPTTPAQPITTVNSGVYSSAQADHTTATGFYSSALSNGATATGSSSKAECENSTADGYGAYAAAPNATALGAHSIAGHENSVTLGYGTQSTQANEVAVGGRKVTQVANGSISQDSMDAVNGGQIWDMEQRWNDRWTNIDQRFAHTDRRLNGLGAQLGAMSMMAATPGEGGLTVGLGYSGGQTAIAFGWSRRLSERTSISVGAAFGGGNKAVFGVGLRIGGR